MNIENIFDLTGKVAIVTGGNGGLGLGMALGLAQAGAHIAIAARNPEKTMQAVSQVEAVGVSALAVSVDLTVQDEINQMVAQTKEHFGRIDILVNNAGISVRKMPQELSVEEWDRVVSVNLRAGFIASQQVYPHIKEQGGGKIINIGSMFSLFGSDWVAPYAASKAGVVQLTKSLAIAWAQDHIQVNAILPGWFMTELTEAIPERDPDRYDLINRRIPTGRWGEPEELQGAAVFLASRASDYVTGAVIAVDGGYSVT